VLRFPIEGSSRPRHTFRFGLFLGLQLEELFFLFSRGRTASKKAIPKPTVRSAQDFPPGLEVSFRGLRGLADLLVLRMEGENGRSAISLRD
jgi:hypothetical protein